MRFSKKFIALPIFAVAAGAAGFLYARSQTPQRPDRQTLLKKAVDLHPAKRAPNFALPDLDGKLHALSQWRGKLRLLNFWATWCGPCREEVPALVALQKHFGPEGFQVIGIATDEPGAKVVKKFAGKFKINYPLLMDNGHAGNIAQHLGFNLIGLPASILIDGNGDIVSYHLGPIDPAATQKQIQKLLNGRKNAINAADRART
ncbi:MAG TPA: TlpA disulfide reductase family protein [Gammaproteobacteria bacterium]|nr:TlpA disulfide reductase family protein [Gammaproteobacteria bacterium]